MPIRFAADANILRTAEDLIKSSKNIDELNELLAALEANMEREISQCKEKYEKKRAPIVEAIQQKNMPSKGSKLASV